MDLDSKVRSIIIDLSPKYDKDGSGTLNSTEITGFLNEALGRLGQPANVGTQEAMEALQKYDRNYDGQVSKEEMFSALRFLANRPPGQQWQPQQQTQQQPQFPQNNPSGPINNPWVNQPPQAPQQDWTRTPQANQNWQQPPYQQWGQQPQGNQWGQQPTNGWNQPPAMSPWSQQKPAPQYPQPNQPQYPYPNQPPQNAQDTQVMQYIDQMFKKYDQDNSGSLDARELGSVFN